MNRSAILLGAMLALAAGGADARTLHFAGDRATGRWCVFTDRSAMLQEATRANERVERLRTGNPGDVLTGEATVARNGAIAAVIVQGGADSGDWAVTDDYRLRGGRVVSMKRVVGHADGSPHAILTYARSGDQLVRRAQTRNSGFVPDWPVYADLTDQPYFALLMKAARLRIPPEGICRR